MIAEYYRYISYLDSQIGRVLDALDASPFAKDTIVVFTADSGVARGSHGLIGKQNVYEYDSVRVPLIVAGPGIAADQRTDAMCLPVRRVADARQAVRHCLAQSQRRFRFFSHAREPGDAGARSYAVRLSRRTARLHRRPLEADPVSAGRPHAAFRLAERSTRSGESCRPARASRPNRELTAALQSEIKAQGDTAPLTVAHPQPAAWTPPVADEQ